MDKSGVVPMRLFANWEMDRASSSVVQRVCFLSLNRVVLHSLPTQAQSIVITAKLEGNKRSLRSNDIGVIPQHGRIDLDLDISFTIQYPHFVKRKGNSLQILIQRRRKFKSRPFPSSFKTIAVGMVNLTQLLQHGGLREIPLWSSDNNDKQSSTVQSVGRLYLVTCQSQPLEIDLERDRISKKHGALEGDLSEEDSDSDYEDAPVDSDVNEPSSARSAGRGHTVQMNHKASRASRKNNIRQRFVTLLKKFKVPDEEGLPSRSDSAAMVPTEKELQDLFEELENMSDSGPEMAADDISIGSNPRPGLRPYFTRSKEVLPAIYDRDAENASESEVEAEDWSSETEKEREKEEIRAALAHSHEISKDSVTSPLAGFGEQAHIHSSVPTIQTRVGFTNSTPLAASTSLGGISHSLTAGSIAKKLSSINSADKGLSVSDQLSSLLSAYPAKSASCWLCSFSDLPHLSSIAVPTVNCSSASVVKQAMSQIVNTIQNFCNSNSSNPPITWIGVIGGDRLVGQILRAYVECLHHKSSSHWLHYLRFAIIPAPHSLVAKLLEGHDAALDQLCRDMWERWTELSPVEKLANTEKMNAWLTAGGGACLNLPIGEALLQLVERGQDADACRVFVPFLAEVRVGQSSEDEDSPYTFSSPRGVESDKEFNQSGRERDFSAALSGSPPNSPQVRTDAHEMHVEYWLGRDPSNENVNSMPSQNVTPNSKKDLSKGSMKATFRTLVITRSCNQHLLSLNFVKEKRKEKMLQKLGMKKGQRSENENPPVQVTAVSRLLCSGASKHTDLTVSVDGSTYQRVRYFQCSSQWQTHIKSFPVSLISQGVGPIGL
ncbi:hypothetical protein V3C99_016412 [Haemonchus contortus]